MCSSSTRSLFTLKWTKKKCWEFQIPVGLLSFAHTIFRGKFRCRKRRDRCSLPRAGSDLPFLCFVSITYISLFSPSSFGKDCSCVVEFDLANIRRGSFSYITTYYYYYPFSLWRCRKKSWEKRRGNWVDFMVSSVSLRNIVNLLGLRHLPKIFSFFFHFFCPW